MEYWAADRAPETSGRYSPPCSLPIAIGTISGSNPEASGLPAAVNTTCYNCFNWNKYFFLALVSMRTSETIELDEGTELYLAKRATKQNKNVGQATIVVNLRNGEEHQRWRG